MNLNVIDYIILIGIFVLSLLPFWRYYVLERKRKLLGKKLTAPLDIQLNPFILILFAGSSIFGFIMADMNYGMYSYLILLPVPFSSFVFFFFSSGKYYGVYSHGVLTLYNAYFWDDLTSIERIDSNTISFNRKKSGRIRVRVLGLSEKNENFIKTQFKSRRIPVQPKNSSKAGKP